MYAKLFVKLLRPKVAVMLALFVCLGMASTQNSVVVSWQFVVLLGVLAAWYVNATSVNDLADEKIDAINLKTAAGRPLVDRTASRTKVVAMAVMSGLVAVVLAYCIAPRYALVILGGVVLSAMYSLPPFRISYKGILAPLLLPVGYVVVPFVGGYMISDGMLDVRLLAACYVGFIGRIILKDFRDIVGDKKYGKRTFVVRHGKSATCLASLAAWIGANVLFARAIPLSVWLLLQPLWLLIVHGLYMLSRARSFRDEQVIIGLMARLANGILIASLAYLLVDAGSGTPVAGVISAIFSTAHLYALRQFSDITIAYKG